MSRFRVLLAGGCLLLAAGTWAQAHEIKALASHLLVPKPGERTTIYLSWGHALPVDDLVDGQTLARYDLVSPAGQAKELAKTEQSLQTNVVEMKEEGVHQVVVDRKSGVVTFVVDKEGRRQLKRGPKTKATGGTVDYALRSEQYAKALIVVGPPKSETLKPVGQKMEIVPQDAPNAWRDGAALRFQVLLDGKPLPEGDLVATYVGFRPDNAWCYATATNHEGVATVRVMRPGTWVLRVHSRKPAPDKQRQEYDYDAYTATLTLEIHP